MRNLPLVATALLLSIPAFASDPLAPTGTLRAAYIVTNLAQATTDPATGTTTGPSADLARELARSTGVPLALQPLPTAAAVLEAVQSGTADIGFVAPNPARQTVLYTQTYMLVQQSAVVRDDSPLTSVTQLDRPGQTIGANQDDSVSLWMKTHFTQAKTRETPDYTLAEAATWFATGAIQAFAGNRQRLHAAIADKPGLHLLPDNLYPVPQAIALRQAQAPLLPHLNATIEALRTSGFLEASMNASGIDGIEVAPPPQTEDPTLEAGGSKPRHQ